MKLISFFVGTDALLISRWKFPCRPYKRLYQIFIRIRTWILDLFVEEYWVDHEGLKDELRKFGIKKNISVHLDDLKYTKSFEKRKHDGFYVLYYWPGDRGNAKMWQWIYGYDIYSKVRILLGNEVNWIIVDGTYDMEAVFPIIDFYLRPNRHDGSSRLRRECDIQNIPYYWTRERPDAREAVKYIRCEYEGKNEN